MTISSRSKRLTISAASLLIVGALAGCTSVSGSSGATGGTGDTTGVTDNSISLGVTGAFTGPLSPSGLAELAGMKLYWDSVNSAGGICDGRQVNIISRDDVYDPQKTVTAYSELQDSVFAMQLVIATAPAAAVAPLMAQNGVVGFTSSAAPSLLDQSSVLVTGTPYTLEMMNSVDYLVKQGTVSRGDSIGYIYFQGEYGQSGFQGAQAAGTSDGITVNGYQVDPTVTDLSAQINDMKGKGVKAILMSASPPLLANAIAVSTVAGLNVPVVVAAPTFDPALLTTASADAIAQRVIVATSLNAWTADNPAMAQLRDLYAKSGETTSPQLFIVQGYGLAKLMDGALQAACAKGPLNRQALADQLSSTKSFDMQGLQVNVSYTDPKAGPAQSTYFLHADKTVAGNLVPLATDPYEGPTATASVK